MPELRYPPPSHVVVMGGGRWARVLTDVLTGLLPPGVPVTVCSPGAAGAVADWASQRGLAERVHTTTAPPTDLADDSVVIVANAARDHVATSRWALAQGAAVLVEKPSAPTLRDLRAVMADAVTIGTFLAPAHVLRFVRYLPAFAARLEAIGRVTSIIVDWADPAGELRYGERKAHHMGTPLPMDVMPHAVSALQEVFSVLPRPAGPPEFEAGGSRVRVPLSVGPWPCSVTLERNGSARRRRIVVTGSRAVGTLDFSSEPGTIHIGSATWVADPMWSRGPRPLASLLGAFLGAAGGGPRHHGLSMDTAEASCVIVDTLRDSYEAQRTAFLVEHLRAGAPLDRNLSYALAEVLQSSGRLSSEILAGEMDRLRQAARGASAQDCRLLLASLKDRGISKSS